LEAGNLRRWYILVKTVTVVKFGVDDGGGNGRGCYEVEVTVCSNRGKIYAKIAMFVWKPQI